jgi:hypothetical protein
MAALIFLAIWLSEAASFAQRRKFERKYSPGQTSEKTTAA